MVFDRKLILDLFHGMRVLAFISFVIGISTFIVSGWSFLANRLEMESSLFDSSVVLVPKISGMTTSNFTTCLQDLNTTDSNNVAGETMPTTTEATQDFSDTSNSHHNIEILKTLRDTMLRCSILVIFLAVIQIVSAAFIIGSSIEGCRGRAKVWFIINSIINISVLICLTMPLMYQIEHSNHFQEISTTTTASNAKSPAPAEESKEGRPCVPPGDEDGLLLTNLPRITHLTSFYLGLAFDFLGQFFVLIGCLLLFRFNRSIASYDNLEHVM